VRPVAGPRDARLLVLDDGAPETRRVDAVFPVLHGKNGEDGTVQGLSSWRGSRLSAAARCRPLSAWTKDVRAPARRSRRALKRPRPLSCARGRSTRRRSSGKRGLRYPLFVKPVCSGSSFGVSRITSPDALSAASRRRLNTTIRLSLRRRVDGFEVGCAVLGNETLTLGEVDEIELTGGFFDYTEKYTLKTSKIHMPAHIAPILAERVKRTAAEIYRLLGCRGLARVDLFLTADREIVFNEVNTIPGFTSHSRYPNMLKGVGLSFPEILDALVGLAVRDENA
jgi:D-alanine---D-serine ligase